MAEDRVHRAVSADGTEIAGRVQGRGPALVLVHSPVHDGDMAWESLLPHLTDRFTCFMPSLRGRGLSGQGPDSSSPRSHFQEDVDAFVDSVGEAVFLMGWSDGGLLALGAAARTDVVSALVAYEPGVWAIMREADLTRFGASAKQWGEATADGRLLDAAHIFHHFVGNDDEFAALNGDYLDRQASLFPLLMREMQHGLPHEGPEPTAPETLRQIDVPVLVLLALQTRLFTWFSESAKHVTEHVTDPHVHELPDVGHLAPLVAPEPVAAEIVSFFASRR
jgi:pimeloyl-ACP methyl ester carboxylesterase